MEQQLLLPPPRYYSPEPEILVLPQPSRTFTLPQIQLPSIALPTVDVGLITARLGLSIIMTGSFFFSLGMFVIAYIFGGQIFGVALAQLFSKYVYPGYASRAITVYDFVSLGVGLLIGFIMISIWVAINRIARRAW